MRFVPKARLELAQPKPHVPETCVSTNSTIWAIRVWTYENQTNPVERKNETRRSAIHSLSEKRDSNPRPRPWQGRALPTELFSQLRCKDNAILIIYKFMWEINRLFLNNPFTIAFNNQLSKHLYSKTISHFNLWIIEVITLLL